jgi:hypothetical protein
MKSIQSLILPELPLIEEVSPWSLDDQALFDDLRAALVKHDATTRFGVTLLHRHFEVSEDEVLVEACDVETRTLTVRPCARTRMFEGTVIETHWRFDTPDSVAQTCWKFCEEEDGHPKGHTPYDDPKS